MKNKTLRPLVPLSLLALCLLLALVISTLPPKASAYVTNSPSLTPPGFGFIVPPGTTYTASGFRGGYFTNDNAVIATDGGARFASVNTTGGSISGGAIYASGANAQFKLATNAVANWPMAAPAPGAAMFVNSNSAVYLLTSSPNSSAWAATNHIAP